MSHPSAARRLLLIGASALIGAFGATAIAGAATANVAGQAKISVSGEADCSPYGENNAFEWSIWWTVENHRDQSATLKKVNLVVSPESAEGEVSMDGLVESSEVDPDGQTQGRITLPENTTVTDLTLEVTLAWQIDDETVTETASDSVTLAADGCADEMYFQWHWSATCDTVAIFFTNPFDEQVDLTFQSATGEVVERTFAPYANEEIRFAYTEGDGVDVTVLHYGEPITQLRIGADDVDRPCTDDDESNGEGGEESLPVTGSTAALIAGGAVVLLGLGAGIFFFARRRRMSFTA